MPVEPSHAIDIVLLTMLAEYLALGLGGRGWGAAMAALLPGALLVLALGAALAGGPPSLPIVLLTLAFPAHLLDLNGRGWLRRGRSAAARGLRAQRLSRRMG